jgi:hypothetical protein
MKQKTISWGKRLVVYVLGLFILAFGVSISKMSDLVCPSELYSLCLSEILKLIWVSVRPVSLSDLF